MQIVERVFSLGSLYSNSMHTIATGDGEHCRCMQDLEDAAVMQSEK